jgi:hypothetical protein
MSNMSQADKLLQNGYYYYALEETFRSQGNWTMHIYDFSTDAHCRAYEPWLANSVHITYTNGTERVDAWVSPNDPIWDPRPIYLTTATSAEWSQFGFFEYMVSDDYNAYMGRVTDLNGMDVVIGSLSFDQKSDLANFIDHMEMVTPPNWIYHNPWEAACEN